MSVVSLPGVVIADLRQPYSFRFAPRPILTDPVNQREGSRYRLYSRGPEEEDAGDQDVPGFAEDKAHRDLVTQRKQ